MFDRRLLIAAILGLHIQSIFASAQGAMAPFGGGPGSNPALAPIPGSNSPTTPESAIAAAPSSASSASNGAANPFKLPTSGLAGSAGGSLTLTWTPTTDGTVSLRLLHGASGANLAPVATLAAHVVNSGAYTCRLPLNLAAGDDYVVEIVDDGDASRTNYTPFFRISNATGGSGSGSDSGSNIEGGMGGAHGSSLSGTPGAASPLPTSMSLPAFEIPHGGRQTSRTFPPVTRTTPAGWAENVQTINGAPRGTAIAMLGVVAWGVLAW